MAYQDRLQPQISLTSPNGSEFSAKWIGDNIRLEKELGVFKTPGIKGFKVQDLEVLGRVYPLTIFFDGPDNDLEAERFSKATEEKGLWAIVHPVKGEKNLQLVSISEAVQPVTSGNITEFNTEWLEVAADTVTLSASELSSTILANKDNIFETATNQLESVVSQDTSDSVSKLKNSAANVVSSFDNSLAELSLATPELESQILSIKRGIDETLTETPVDVLSLAGQLLDLVNLPVLSLTDISSTIDTYSKFADLILSNSPDTSTRANINYAAVQELALTSVLISAGVASASKELRSRQEVINAIESNIDLFNKVSNGLDDIQALFVDDLLKDSYFSQSISFQEVSRNVSLVKAYLIKSAFDLAVEKIITLDRPENPIMVAMREYSGPGQNDENIDLFIESNSISGFDLIVIPAGRELVVYL